MRLYCTVLHCTVLYCRSLQSLVARGDPNILQLHGLSRGDTGEYVCQARNTIGTAEVSIHLHVHCEYTCTLTLANMTCILYPDLPEVSPVSHRVYSGEGGTAELGCRVLGYPEPMVSTGVVRVLL